nr:protein translocase subunit SECA2, chloroplastic isoform X1 [Ipomoea batatas]
MTLLSTSAICATSASLRLVVSHSIQISVSSSSASPLFCRIPPSSLGSHSDIVFSLVSTASRPPLLTSSDAKRSDLTTTQSATQRPQLANSFVSSSSRLQGIKINLILHGVSSLNLTYFTIKIRKFNFDTEWAVKLISMFTNDEDTSIEGDALLKQLFKYFFSIRKSLVEFDEVLELSI